jgi:hypothetical protein
MNKYGKCSLSPKDEDEDNTYFLVDGIKPKKQLYFCSTARQDFKNMCGPEGKFYEKK